ncbi:MAG: DUF2189 domain-containing protein [Rhodobacteraceae bacterium]|nr:DUF2189 domain-containing protein [Paracoccaceae bacterium]
MTDTIGNPLSWGARALAGAGDTLAEAGGALGGTEAAAVPQVRRIGAGHLGEALRRGLADFAAVRSDVLFLAAIYPILGVVLSVAAFHGNLLALLFPLAAGFALIGPVAGIALYEISRRRERGEAAGWGAALHALRAHAVGPALVLGVGLLGIFTLWLFLADAIWRATLGPEVPASVAAFARQVLTTPAGWEMIVAGIAVGAVLASAVLVTTLVAFPMVIDRRVGVPLAVATSVRVARANPGPVAAWGAIVALSLAVASVPAFLGLVVVLPVLGHATWHLYRAAVAWVPARNGAR